MQFEFAGVLYKIWFRHTKTPDGRRETKCFIDVAQAGPHFADDRPPVGEGGTICAPMDVFCKETGRKVALTRALRGVRCIDDRGFRRAAWNCYLNRAKKATHA